MTRFNAGLAYHDFRQVQRAYRLAALVAFLMSSYFVVGYLAGHLEAWMWSFSQWINGLVGFGITGTMTAFQFFLYGKGDLGAGKVATFAAVFVAASFSLLSEVGQGVERDNIRMETKSQESPTYQAIVGQLAQGSANPTPPNPYAYSLQRAETLLARCREKVQAGAWKDCNESEARLKSVKDLIQQHYQQQKEQRLALANLAKDLERDENNYHPLVNFIRQVFGVSGITGSFLLSLLIIGFFEYGFHYLGGLYARKKEQLLVNGFDVTTKERITPLPVRLINADQGDLHATNTPLHARVSPKDNGFEYSTDTPDLHARGDLYTLADNAEIGQLVRCPVCETEFKKRNKQHRFCCKEHRYQWHNKRSFELGKQ